MTTPESIYGGIKRLLENASLRKDVAVAGKRLVASSYSVERVADRMIDAYQAVLKRAQSKCRRQTMSK
jgi:glycosyltransferase involved in cell wall biosynthesis